MMDIDDVWQNYPVLNVGEGGVGGVDAHFAVSELDPCFWAQRARRGRGSDGGRCRVGVKARKEPRLIPWSGSALIYPLGGG